MGVQIARTDRRGQAPVGNSLSNLGRTVIIGGRFVRGGEIGSGGNGIVFNVTDRITGISLVAKQIKTNLEALKAEAIANYQLTYLGRMVNFADTSFPLARSYGVKKGDDGNAYLIFEKVSGQTLFDILREKKRLPLAEALDIAVKICDALIMIKEEKMVHGDIKPENIFYDAKTGAIKIIDFGQAVLSGEKGKKATLLFSSPEQTKQDKVDEKADVFSTCLTLVELLNGKNGFLRQRREQMINAEFTSPHIPRDLADCLYKAAHPAREQRSTLEQLRAGLIELRKKYS
ncbi:MAG: protein kinase [Candidatus Margulisbacteria bacterium]|nr:protein kinase [Candidatus Margulisiibacteriota bacterium]